MSRKTAIVISVIVVVIVVALLVVPSLLDVNQYRGKIQAELQQRLNRPVSLGPIHLRLLPPCLRVENVSIGEDPHFGRGAFAQAQELDVSIELWPLLHKEVAVSSLRLQRPHMELIRDRQGAWNFASLGHNAPPTAPPAAGKPPAKAHPPQAPPQNSPSQQQAFALDNLQISDGQVALTDYQKHQSRAVYDHIDLSLKNFAPGRPFTVGVTAHLPGRGTQALELNADAGPINNANLLDTPLDGRLRLNQVSLAGIQKFLNSQALTGMDATISGTMKISNQKGTLASNGDLRLEDTRFRGLAIGYPITANYNVTDDLNGDVIRIQKGSIKLGSTPLDITGEINTRPTPALLDVQLRASNASIAEAARLAAAFGVAFAPGVNIAGQLSADIHARGASNIPSLNGMLSLRDLAASGKGLPVPVNVKQVTLNLTPQEVRSNSFTASTGLTSLAVQFTLAGYTTPSPAIDATLRTANAKIGELLNMARAYGISAVEGMTGSGSLDLDVRATGPMKNPSGINFSGTGRVQNASIKPPSLKQPLQVRNADLRFTRNSAVLQNLAASLGQTHASGNLTLQDFSAPRVQFSLNADKLDVAELQQITASAPAPPPRRAAGGFWQLVSRAEAAPAPASQSSILAAMTGTGTVNIGTVLYDQLVLNNVHSNATLDHGLIRLAPLTAQLYGGQQSGTIVVDARRTPLSFSVSTQLSRVQANQLISAVSPIKQTLYGLLAANGQTSFSAVSSADIARTLNGKLSLNLSNGRIAGIDLLNQLASIGKFLGAVRQAQPFTNIAKLSGDFNITNGLAQTSNLQAVIEGGTLAAAGAVNLADQSLNLHLTAVLSKAMSQQVGGTQVGGLMTTALANRQGELVIPAIVTGTFQRPIFAPDVQKITQMKLRNLLPTSSNPGNLTSGILGALGKNAGQQGGVGGILGALAGQKQQPNPPPPAGQPQGNTQQQQQVQNPLQEALGSLLGKKKKSQPPPPPR